MQREHPKRTALLVMAAGELCGRPNQPRLPHKLQRKLNLARGCGCSSDVASTSYESAGSVENLVVGCRRIKISMIERVENLYAKLNVKRLRNTLDGIVLEQREVKVDQAWSNQAVAPGIAD